MAGQIRTCFPFESAAKLRNPEPRVFSISRTPTHAPIHERNEVILEYHGAFFSEPVARQHIPTRMQLLSKLVMELLISWTGNSSPSRLNQNDVVANSDDHPVRSRYKSGRTPNERPDQQCSFPQQRGKYATPLDFDFFCRNGMDAVRGSVTGIFMTVGMCNVPGSTLCFFFFYPLSTFGFHALSLEHLISRCRRKIFTDIPTGSFESPFCKHP